MKQYILWDYVLIFLVFALISGKLGCPLTRVRSILGWVLVGFRSRFGAGSGISRELLRKYWEAKHPLKGFSRFLQ